MKHLPKQSAKTSGNDSYKSNNKRSETSLISSVKKCLGIKFFQSYEGGLQRVNFT